MCLDYQGTQAMEALNRLSNASPEIKRIVEARKAIALEAEQIAEAAQNCESLDSEGLKKYVKQSFEVQGVTDEYLAQKLQDALYPNSR